MEKSISILATKKLSSIQRQKFLIEGFSITETNFIATSSLYFNDEISFQNIIFTSKNAVESVLFHNNKKKLIANCDCFCVGATTRALLEENGIAVKLEKPSAIELATALCEEYSQESFIFFCGNMRKDDLPKLFKEKKINWKEIIVYETQLLPQKIEDAQDGVLFFSPSAVDAFLQENKLLNQVCFAIGKTTAEKLNKYTNKVITAQSPTIDETIAMCINYFNNQE